MALDETIALVDVDDLLIELDLPETEYMRIERLINEASAAIERYGRQPFRPREVTRILTGSPHPLLDLGGRIVSVTSVTIDGVALSAGDYRVLAERGELYREGGWATYSALSGGGVNNVEVTATLGWDPVPHDVRRACIELVRYWHANRGRVGLTSERVTEYAYTRAAGDDIPPEIASLIPRRW
ncbi:MAG: hypothetical protein QN174_07780 [Armatimonadota bacterium]|nr:hypothetical protein [Armatimonadota bacterium]